MYGLTNKEVTVGRKKSGSTNLIENMSENKWIHLTTKYEGNTGKIKVFLDGNLEIEDSIEQSNPSGNLIVGADRGGSNLLNSNIDDLTVWNQALPDYLIPALASGARFTFTTLTQTQFQINTKSLKRATYLNSQKRVMPTAMD